MAGNPRGLMGIGTEGNLGRVDTDFGAWNDLGRPADWSLQSLTRNTDGHYFFFVGTDGNVGKWDNFDWTMTNQGLWGQWTLTQLLMVDQTYYGVGAQGNVGVWTGAENGEGSWNSESGLSTWTIGSLTVSPQTNDFWGVGTQGNLGSFDSSTQAWTDQKSNWTLRSIAFDADGDLWGVGTQGNLGLWVNDAFETIDAAGGWSLNAIYFDPFIGY